MAQPGHNAKIEVAPGAKESASRLFGGGGMRRQFSLCAPIVPLRDATFLQMTRLLQVTGKHVPKTHRAQTDFIRLVSSELMLWGGPPVVRDGRFDRLFEKSLQKKLTIMRKGSC